MSTSQNMVHHLEVLAKARFRSSRTVASSVAGEVWMSFIEWCVRPEFRRRMVSGKVLEFRDRYFLPSDLHEPAHESIARQHSPDVSTMTVAILIGVPRVRPTVLLGVPIKNWSASDVILDSAIDQVTMMYDGPDRTVRSFASGDACAIVGWQRAVSNDDKIKALLTW